jgi:uncharacterized membrane protein (UPF0136 family)
VNVRIAGTYALLLLAVVGCFGLIFYGRGNEEQAWAVLGIVIGALVRDAASIQSAQSTERIAAATASQQPTITTTSGPPATTTITPPDPREPYPDDQHDLR